MSFLNGRLTYARYRVSGLTPLPFGPEHLEQIERNAIGGHGTGEPADGVSSGWAGGDHVLDVQFELEKNVLEDCLHLAFRLDTDKIPSSLLRAYTEIELKALAANNPTGHPTKAQRAEAKELALAKADLEAVDGRFRKIRHFPVLWDGRANVLYAGVTSVAVLDRLQALFKETFDRTLEPITAGSLADAGGLASAPELSLVMGDGGPASIAWSESTPSSLDFLGNEFLIWLWHTLQNEGDTLSLPDGTEASVMLAKTLTLDCPRGEMGRDQLTDEGPTRLPEAFRALQSGKLPRKAGLVITRHGMTYDMTIQAETLDVTGGGLPKTEGVSGREASLARIESLRHMVETLDLVYETFIRRRLAPDWSGEIGRIRLWLQPAA